MSEHKHGDMDIKVQEQTFNGFIRTVMYGAYFCIFVLIFLALVNG